MKNCAYSSIRGPDPASLSRAARRWVRECVRGAQNACTDGPAARVFVMVFTLVLAMLVNLLTAGGDARAQTGIMANGDLAVTGFSGTKDIGGQAFIDTGGASLKVYDASGKGAASGQVVNAPAKFEAFARDIGQVFGVALDNAPNPNIYATATSVHGLQIVIPDNNGDGVPERVTTGQPGATFMEGQFGNALGGGPGTVYRIDGATGEITKFADITFGGIPNSGAGLGNIAYDPAHFQFYVSDLDTGAIHRLDLSGTTIGVFDHGVDGRQAAGLPAVPMNAGDTMDITNLGFDTTNADTWGLADPKRRVWGLAYFKERLYYAVAQGAQIWSVGINSDGTFASDARIEIQAVPGGKAVSDILFTPQGRMILAQRGGIMSSPDYTQYHMPQQNSVLRYSRDTNGNWIQEPDEYAIGFPADHRNASGGVGLACDGTLWSTGDALANDPATVVHGLQGNDVSHVRPLNVPPFASWFIDYKNGAGQAPEAGHVGDVEVYRNCPGGYTESFPGWYPIPDWAPSYDWSPPVWWPRTPDLNIEKFAHQCEFVPGLLDTVECKYTLVVTNFGAADFIGHLNVTDTPDDPNADFVPPAGGSIPWTCNQPGGPGTPIDCVSDNVENLHPGESEILEITVRITNPVKDKPIRNCAVVDDPFDFWLNEDCDESELPRPDLKIKKTFHSCVPEGANQRCFFILSFENVGGAPYSGPLSFEEHVPAGALFGAIHFATTPGWGCIGGAPIKCTLPDPPGVTMNPGDVEGVVISVIVPGGIAGDMENCVNLGEPAHAGDPLAPGANKDCEPFTVAAAFEPKCPDGWAKVPAGGAPAGMLVIAVHGLHPDGTPWALMCMKPKPLEEVAPMEGPKPDPEPPLKTPDPDPVGPSCAKGEKLFASARQVPQGWTSRKVTKGNRTIWCARPQVFVPEPLCKRGETKYSSLRQVPKGWTWRKVTLGKRTIYCARPKLTLPQPQCRKGERKYTSARLVPKGWTSRKVTLGNATVWCARPGLTYPDPVGPKCASGEKQVKSPRLAPKGWTVRTVGSGKRRIYCAKPGTIVPKKPLCKGGKLVLLKTMPPRWRCLCPKGTSLKNGTCTRDIPQSTVPQIKPCPKGWNRVRGKCFPPKPKPQATPEIKPCPKNWNRVRGKCFPPKLQIKPNNNLKLKVKPQSKKPSLKKRPKATIKKKQNTGNMMLLAPSTTLNSGPRRKLR